MQSAAGAWPICISSGWRMRDIVWLLVKIGISMRGEIVTFTIQKLWRIWLRTCLKILNKMRHWKWFSKGTNAEFKKNPSTEYSDKSREELVCKRYFKPFRKPKLLATMNLCSLKHPTSSCSQLQIWKRNFQKVVMQLSLPLIFASKGLKAREGPNIISVFFLASIITTK